MQTKGSFVMIDGIDGSGKSTVLTTWQSMLMQEGRPIFVLKDFWKEQNRHPLLEEIPEGTFAIISAEPTSVWAGAAIRQEMVARSDRTYTPRAIAEAFALDRLVLYTRVLLPALRRGMHVIQDRGVSTSLCYQSVQGDFPLAEIAKIEGNAFALSHPPDVLMLMDVSPDVCMARLSKRLDKQDDAIFEELPFMKKVDACFRSDAFVTQFTSRGTIVERFPADQDLAILEPQLRNKLEQFLSL